MLILGHAGITLAAAAVLNELFDRQSRVPSRELAVGSQEKSPVDSSGLAAETSNYQLTTENCRLDWLVSLGKWIDIRILLKSSTFKVKGLKGNSEHRTLNFEPKVIRHGVYRGVSWFAVFTFYCIILWVFEMSKDTSRFTLDMDPQTRLRLKMVAARKGITMREYCLFALERQLSEDEVGVISSVTTQAQSGKGT